jgi:Copper transport outer membrane protein, MctB
VFDLRYHVASLTAVFLALVIGILVGIGISGRGFVDESERRRLNGQIAELQESLDAADEREEELERRQEAAEEFVSGAYPVLADERLAETDVVVLIVGSSDATLGWVTRALEDSDARLLRMRALGAPVRMDEIQETLESRSELGGYVGDEHVEDLGRDLGRELVAGGTTPLWDALERQLTVERRGESTAEADAVVVIRAGQPQQGETARFLAGVYSGLASSGEPVVGVEVSRVEQSAIPTFQRHGISTVDGIDEPIGRFALVLLLAGASPGDYGTRDTAEDGFLPPIEPLPTVDGG